MAILAQSRVPTTPMTPGHMAASPSDPTPSHSQVTLYLLDMVRMEKQCMPMILHLGNKALQREHWSKIFAGMQKPYAPDTTYTLDGLRMWKIFDYRVCSALQTASQSEPVAAWGTRSMCVQRTCMARAGHHRLYALVQTGMGL